MLGRAHDRRERDRLEIPRSEEGGAGGELAWEGAPGGGMRSERRAALATDGAEEGSGSGGKEGASERGRR